MTKQAILSAVISAVIVSSASADSLAGFNTVTYDSPSAGNLRLTGITDGLSYGSGQFVFGSTERYYNSTNGGTFLWTQGDPVPADIAAIANTSTPKRYDVGADADNEWWQITPSPDGGGTPDIASLDALPYLKTIFDSPVSTIYVFERSGSSIDPGTVQPILSSDGTSLGAGQSITALQVAGASTGQNTWGFVYRADSPIWGIQINSPGFDALSILTAVPEPTSFALAGLGMAALLVFRRRS